MSTILAVKVGKKYHIPKRRSNKLSTHYLCGREIETDETGEMMIDADHVKKLGDVPDGDLCKRCESSFENK
ncbi:MAG: hypothetical protein U9N61_10080 [Euryarchaeota archaeon]|nr:hypothetical protein [Euryarchaeota archaeon]